jgi:hypothetical protein
VQQEQTGHHILASLFPHSCIQLSRENREGEIMVKRRAQLTIIIGASIIVIAFTVVAYITHPDSFVRYFGRINPFLIIPGLSVLGITALIFVLSKNGFEMFRGVNLKRTYPFYLLAILLASIAIVIDMFFKYPEDTHIHFPLSVLFYPVMGYVVETLFHVLPLSLLLLLFKAVSGKFDPERHVWPCILIISIIEPTFQTVLSPKDFPVWIMAYVWVHLYIFNFLQLFIFKRYDFLKMYLFRLVYYLTWHIVWGFVRLRLLF